MEIKIKAFTVGIISDSRIFRRWILSKTSFLTKVEANFLLKIETFSRKINFSGNISDFNYLIMVKIENYLSILLISKVEKQKFID